MFGKKKTEESATPVSQLSEEPTGKNDPRQKGKPTPKRKEAEKRNERPLVVSKKEARRKRKAKRDEAYAKQQAALNGTGDPRYLPLNDQGPIRRYIRDYLDSRFLPGQLFMPFLLVFLLCSWFVVRSPQAAQILMIIMWVYFIYIFVEASLITFLINRKLLAAADGNKLVKQGNGRYVIFRSPMPKIMRRPKRAKKFGEYPDIADYAPEIRQWLRNS